MVTKCGLDAVTLTHNALVASMYCRKLLPAALEAAGMGKHIRRKCASSKRPKSKRGLPDLDHSKVAFLDSLRSPESKRGSQHAMDEFIQWYCSEPRLSFNKVVLTRYRISLENRGLAAGTINGRLAAVRRLAYEAAASRRNKHYKNGWCRRMLEVASKMFGLI